MGDPQRTDEETPPPSGSVINSGDQYPEKAARNNRELQPRFPRRNDVSKPMSEASINKVIKLLGYHGRLTGHGFRHTMSTILHEHGFESARIEMQLAHVDKNSIRGTYNHAQYIKDRQVMMEWYASLLNTTCY